MLTVSSYVDAAYCYRTSTVVCLATVTLVSPAKTAEPIQMPFRLRTRIGMRNHVLDWGPDPSTGRRNLEGRKPYEPSFFGSLFIIVDLNLSIFQYLASDRYDLNYQLLLQITDRTYH